MSRPTKVTYPAEEWEQISDELAGAEALDDRILQALNDAPNDDAIEVELHDDDERRALNRAVNTLGLSVPDDADPSDVQVL